ncbi:PP2C family protein-serine/threonine phosphatase [Smaragdicoccus niigatensis]|uniref:PP2C family protein-serine/threonine phosphatase n=1 Tax=Smaragdicoccus niigatensis TaxID=359359 RepID=UPI0003A1597D|nr:SpoIIE family protein phosphatase [Smaragdicoccus niigatensis]
MAPTSDSGARPPLISVLLVEDDEGDAILAEDLIADVAPEIRIEWVASAGAARDRLAVTIPDCVLLDLHLPDADGIGALKLIQESAPQVPVVVFTGLADQGFGASAVAAGAQDYLVKGRVEADGLRRALHYAIERKNAEKTAAALQASQLRAEENARLERGLLPTPCINSGVEVVARYRPGAASALLGGDFYDVVQTDDGLVHVIIGDVCGHGPDAAALGVALRIGWRALVIANVIGAPCLRHLDRLLEAERSGRFTFATVMTLTIDPRTGWVDAVRAGHPPMMMHGPTTVDWLETARGRALGIPGTSERPVHRLQLRADQALVLLTDGVFEGHSGPRERLGEAGLLCLAQPLASLGGSAFVDELISAAEAVAAPYGGFGDDVAVLRLQIKEDGAR